MERNLVTAYKSSASCLTWSVLHDSRENCMLSRDKDILSNQSDRRQLYRRFAKSATGYMFSRTFHPFTRLLSPTLAPCYKISRAFHWLQIFPRLYMSRDHTVTVSFFESHQKSVLTTMYQSSVLFAQNCSPIDMLKVYRKDCRCYTHLLVCLKKDKRERKKCLDNKLPCTKL